MFLKGPKGCGNGDDSPEVRQGAALSSSLHQLCAGTGEPARANHGLEAEIMVFQPKSVRDVFPQHAMSLKPASATFDNGRLFSKVSLISKPLQIGCSKSTTQILATGELLLCILGRGNLIVLTGKFRG